MNRNRLLRKSGKRYDGLTCYCVDRLAVPFEGHYALKRNKNGYYDPDPKTPIRWVEEEPDDPDHLGGYWEYV
jgi:hypothetical protein